MNENIRNYVMEFIGAFFLVFAIGMTLIEPQVQSAPFIIGLTLLVMIFIGGHISGGHYNPAVSTAVFLQKKLGLFPWIGYLIAQVLGACVAGVLAIYLKDATAVTIDIAWGRAFIVELIYTFVLVFAVLSTSLLPAVFSVLSAGIAVGLIVLTGSATVGAISGGAFNPAVVLGALILGIYKIQDIWVILLANFLASFCAVILFHKVKITLSEIQFSPIVEEQLQKIKEEKKEEKKEEQIVSLSKNLPQDLPQDLPKKRKSNGARPIRFARHNSGITRDEISRQQS